MEMRLIRLPGRFWSYAESGWKDEPVDRDAVINVDEIAYMREAGTAQAYTKVYLKSRRHGTDGILVLLPLDNVLERLKEFGR